MKKVIIISGIVFAVVAAAGVAVYFLFFNSGTAQQTPSINNPVGVSTSSPSSPSLPSVVTTGASNMALPPDYVGSASKVMGNLPTGPYLQIGTSKGAVQIKNFYLQDPPVVDGGGLFIKSGVGYWITYDPAYSSFWVAINGTPFDTVREKAEQDFLAVTGVSQTDACKLDVSVGVPYSPGNPLDGQSFPLSFCTPRN